MDDAMFSADISDDPSTKAMRRSLMPQGCTEPNTVLQEFSRNFEQRYGPMHPLFYVGPLSDAVREATSGSAMSGTVSRVVIKSPPSRVLPTMISWQLSVSSDHFSDGVEYIVAESAKPDVFLKLECHYFKSFWEETSFTPIHIFHIHSMITDTV